jgi:hypothetical protein
LALSKATEFCEKCREQWPAVQFVPLIAHPVRIYNALAVNGKYYILSVQLSLIRQPFQL